ncbi:biotin--[acetyl-CoA-carboxylase] ligase [Undibacterium seohonense]|nr:biotin--[acetyl-CoA-carboxylase] ligase [Undibacterium seohonense]
MESMRLEAKAIEQALYQLNQANEYPSLQIEVVEQTGSTNADLMQRAKNLQTPTLLLARHQTAGKGRAGRSWLSTPDGVLTFSLAWEFQSGVQGLIGLPLAVGVAIAERLQQLGVPVKLKWPNDLLKESKKLAGILVESQVSSAGSSWAIIGIGLNLRVPDELEQRIGQAVADAAWLAQMDRNQLVAQLLQALQAALIEFSTQGFAAFVDRWNRLHAHANQAVMIIDQQTVLQQGIALGVDQQGCLILQTEKGEVLIHSGDVSLRPLP